MKWVTFSQRLWFNCLFTAVSLLIASTAAAIECYECHGVKVPPDYRPLDSPLRDAFTGGFPGSHRTHMDAGATPASCQKCHPGSSGYTSAHRNSLIQLSTNINASNLE